MIRIRFEQIRIWDFWYQNFWFDRIFCEQKILFFQRKVQEISFGSNWITEYFQKSGQGTRYLIGCTKKSHASDILGYLKMENFDPSLIWNFLDIQSKICTPKYRKEYLIYQNKLPIYLIRLVYQIKDHINQKKKKNPIKWSTNKLE